MTKHFSYFMSASLIGGATVALLACSTATASSSAVAPAPVKAHEAAAATKTPPAKVFDLSHWNITLPMDKNRDGKVDTVKVKALKKYSHPDFFYLDENNHMVFTAE